MIIFDQVSKTFPNGTVALEGVSFTVDPKEFVIVTGPSGAGKTTLLRLLLREFLPSGGRIFVDKVDISTLKKSGIPELRRQIGAAFQDFKLLPDWTVGENIGLGLEILGEGEAEIADRVNHLLELTGLKDKSPLFPGQLSGGELQRVVIARALAPEPKVLFADEPTGNLDDATARQIISLLKDINKLGTTVIMATHNPRLVNDPKERLIVLEKGKLVKDTRSKAKISSISSAVEGLSEVEGHKPTKKKKDHPEKET
ncbi:MAG: ATP-binding cassette domain-containing protein [Candidatus Chisholmbacteria bacterium]|nr:ATP-binding cassette domain-containing protein [Candidatus Chisholmbacteria bacterium]